MQKNRMFHATISCLAILLCTGCANTQGTAEESKTENTAVPQLMLEYSQSGGLVGLYDHLLIMSNGECSLKRKNSMQNFTLDKTEMSELDALLKDCYPDPVEPTKPGAPVLVMADYVTCTFKTAEHEFSYADVKMPERISKLVEEINKRYIQRKPQ